VPLGELCHVPYFIAGHAPIVSSGA